MIEFKQKYSLQNGNKVTKKNWGKVFAYSERPCTNVLGVPAIEAAKFIAGNYFEKWKLVYEDTDPERTGYIFREINHNGGINGMHKTPKQAIWGALTHNHIKVCLEE